MYSIWKEDGATPMYWSIMMPLTNRHLLGGCDIYFHYDCDVKCLLFDWWNLNQMNINPKSWTHFSRLTFKVGTKHETYRHMWSNHLQNDIPNIPKFSKCFNKFLKHNEQHTLDVELGLQVYYCLLFMLPFGGVEEYPHWLNMSILANGPPVPLVDLWQSNRPRSSNRINDSTCFGWNEDWHIDIIFI